MYGSSESHTFSLRSKPVGLSSISHPFEWLSQFRGQVSYVLCTRAPLYSALLLFAFDLHVLGTPPAFVLSQDQTLRKVSISESRLYRLSYLYFNSHVYEP
jgi:hypothetical protein